MTDVVREQREICASLGVQYVAAPEHLKVGINENVRSGLTPINGLRHPPEGDTTGWYVWAGGEVPREQDYFVPLHVAHLHEWCPDILKFLGLPPGYRFLKASDYEDIWFDEKLLSPEE